MLLTAIVLTFCDDLPNNIVFPTFVVIDEPVKEERFMELARRVERVIEDVPIALVIIEEAVIDES